MIPDAAPIAAKSVSRETEVAQQDTPPPLPARTARRIKRIAATAALWRSSLSFRAQTGRYTAATALRSDADNSLEGRLNTEADVVEFLGEVAKLLDDDYDVRVPSDSELSIKVTNREKRSAAVWATLSEEDSYYGIVIAIDLRFSEVGEPVPYTFGFWASTNNARLIAERIRRGLGQVTQPST